MCFIDLLILNTNYFSENLKYVPEEKKLYLSRKGQNFRITRQILASTFLVRPEHLKKHSAPLGSAINVGKTNFNSDISNIVRLNRIDRKKIDSNIGNVMWVCRYLFLKLNIRKIQILSISYVLH